MGGVSIYCMRCTVNVELIEGDIENLIMIEDGTYDIAISIFALDWMQNLDAAFKEA